LPQESSPVSAPRVDARHASLGLIEMLRNSKEFSGFTMRSFIFHWGMFFTQPLYTIYWVRTLHATEGWIGVLSMIGAAMTILFYPWWGRVTTRRGTTFGLYLTTLGLAIYPFVTVLAPSIEWIILVQFLSGVTSSGYGVTFFNRLLEVSPESSRPSHIAGYNTLINIAAFFSPLISTMLTNVWDIRVLLVIGALLRLAGPILFWERSTVSPS
jgi:MFS family permease